MKTPQVDKIVRSNRSTIALKITSQAKLIVYAPRLTPLWMINKLVKSKTNWIKKKIGEVEQQFPFTRPKEFVHGEQFLYLGERYELQIVNLAPKPLSLEGAFILSATHKHKARDLFTKWYKKEAQYLIEERVELISRQSGISYEKVRIADTYAQWGSCNTEGNLSFCWRLIMAPLEVIDYIVAHELAHRKEMNHSPRFWAVVERMDPEYKKHRAWLRKNGDTLML